MSINDNENARAELNKTKRLVVKIGTSSLVYPDGGTNFQRISVLVRVICDLMNRGMEVILVSSGAIGIGTKMLRLEKKPETLDGRQAAAAVGQAGLMHVYNTIFGEYGYLAAQMLLTRDVVDSEESSRNVSNTFTKLLSMKVVPVVNENDSVAVDEIKFGDNDNLSYVVAKLVKADLLVILTDTDGYYDKDPKEPGAEIYHNIVDLSEEVERAAGDSEGRFGTGGMLTKVHACRLAADSGINALIANGKDPEILYSLIEGKDVGTLFVRKNTEDK